MGAYTKSKILAIVSGPLACILFVFFIRLDEKNPQISYMAGITLWMAIWWFTEAVHLAVTAFIPFLFIPLLGIGEAKIVAQQYSDSIIFLFLGGFMLAFAIEKYDLHRRIALKVLSVVGSNPASVLFGTMLSTYLISNWISNTATTIMLFGAVLALVIELEKHIPQNHAKFAAAMLLGLAYAATIGGMATPVGTPPNMFFFKEYLKNYPELHDLNFLKWAMIGYPISFAFLLACYLVLKKYFLKNVKKLEVGKSFFKDTYKELGKVCFEQKVIIGIFLSCVLLWFTREDLIFDSFVFKGWKNIFALPKAIDDGSVAIAAALALFLIPSKKNKGEALLTWDDAKKIRYDIILLFGSGFALAYGFEQSGLSDWLALRLVFMKHVHPVILIAGICVIVTIISEFASNIASIQLCIPIMISLQKEIGVHPLLLMMPATFAASLGFMLPVATAANTIVFGTNKINIKDMLKVGLVLDIIGIVIITLLTYFYLR
ncbi:MAG TPA: DASS family sodium-coupled anion symporter [Bacteroidia bacterium]|nr:DASS family sodium-coupled anion symporter [Bacteroidia bacterium]